MRRPGAPDTWLLVATVRRDQRQAVTEELEKRAVDHQMTPTPDGDHYRVLVPAGELNAGRSAVGFARLGAP